MVDNRKQAGSAGGMATNCAQLYGRSAAWPVELKLDAGVVAYALIPQHDVGFRERVRSSAAAQLGPFGSNAGA